MLLTHQLPRRDRIGGRSRRRNPANRAIAVMGAALAWRWTCKGAGSCSSLLLRSAGGWRSSLLVSAAGGDGAAQTPERSRGFAHAIVLTFRPVAGGQLAALGDVGAVGEEDVLSSGRHHVRRRGRDRRSGGGGCGTIYAIEPSPNPSSTSNPEAFRLEPRPWHRWGDPGGGQLNPRRQSKRKKRGSIRKKMLLW